MQIDWKRISFRFRSPLVCGWPKDKANYTSTPSWSLFTKYFVSAAVPKSSHFGIFGLIKHKLGLTSGAKTSKHRQTDQDGVDESLDTEYLTGGVLESPQVVRIRRQESQDQSQSPVVVRRKVTILITMINYNKTITRQECWSVSHVMSGLCFVVKLFHDF